jgi:futalosine hydrolase
LGVQDSDHFKDVFDMNFLNPNSSPFQNKALYNPHWNKISILPFPLDDAITVNEITSNPSRVQQLIQNYKPGIESMEGAALHYTCLRLNQPFLQIRAISNKITDRDKSRWDIPGALENLAVKTRELLNSLP